MLHCLTELFPRLSEKNYFALYVCRSDSSFLNSPIFLKNKSSIKIAPLAKGEVLMFLRNV